MSNPLPTKFLLHQLATHEQDRERFNLVSRIKAEISRLHLITDNQKLKNIKGLKFGNFNSFDFSELNLIYQEYIIRICLSRIDGQAVLGVFKKVYDEVYSPYTYNNLTEELYTTFDHPLCNGKPLDTALQALHHKMLELVPEYVEFIKNNK